MATAVCTTYYVDRVQAVDDESLAYQVYRGKHGSARGRIRWRDHDGDVHISYVEPRESYAAQVEGTTELVTTDGQEVMLQYEGGGRWYQTDAPRGLGSRLNALVVGRDCATNHTPWGSRIVWTVHPRLTGAIRGTMFVADVFGVRADEDRFDLFVQHGISEKVRMAYQVEPPASCERLSWHPVRSLQEILKSMGYYQGDVDGIVGPLTISAAERWVTDDLPEDGRADLDVYLREDDRYPTSYLPRDPALFWWTRRVYCEGR